MEFEQFEKIMNAMRLLDEEVEGLAKALLQYFDNRLICTIGQGTSKAVFEAVEVALRGKPLRMVLGKEWSDIDWFFYETDSGQKNNVITNPDGTTKEIKTLRDLYDLIRFDA